MEKYFGCKFFSKRDFYSTLIHYFHLYDHINVTTKHNPTHTHINIKNVCFFLFYILRHLGGFL